jgi:glycosyltransferase involved in cell wall biosynthesis
MVSVIVPAFDAEAEVRELLAALGRQTAPADAFEVIVVDDGSSDGTADAAERAGARVVRCAARGGSYKARNAGLAEARGEVIAFTDADCVPAENWIERGLAAIEASQSGVVAGRIEFDLDPDPNLAALLDCARFLDQEAHVRAGYGATANLWTTHAVLQAVGHFNPRVTSGGDADWGLRAAAAGRPTEFASDVVVLHSCRDRLTELSRKANRLGRGLAQLRRFGAGPTRATMSSRWNRPGFYRPRRALPGFKRIEEHGHSLGPGRRTAIMAAEYVFVRLPMAFGEIRESRALAAAPAAEPLDAEAP